MPSNYPILLVDDDRLVLTAFSSGLTRVGYTVLTADSVDEAENVLTYAEKKPALVILDVSMPKRSGLELTPRLNELQIPFLLLTAFCDESIIYEATLRGAFGYLVKPVETHQMIPGIEAAIARSRELYLLKENTKQLQTALTNEREINVAIGITMMQKQKSRLDAFGLLRKAARDQRRKLSELSEEIVGAIDTLFKMSNDSKN